jgi:hypothetical protein
MPEHRKGSKALPPHLATRIQDVWTALRWLRPFVIEAWIAGTLITFVWIRVLGSETAKRVLSRLLGN